MSVLNDLAGNPKLTTSFITAGAFGIATIVLLIFWRDGMAVLSALFGLAFGWMGGILLAPYKGEKEHFQKVSKGLVGFMTGFLAAKFDRVFDLLIENKSGSPLILNPYVVRRFGVGIICALVSCLTVFVARTYWQVYASK